MYHTQYSHLSNQELLARCSNRRDYSDLIEELCSRIEELESTAQAAEKKDNRVSCPICNGKLRVEESADSNRHYLVFDTNGRVV